MLMTIPRVSLGVVSISYEIITTGPSPVYVHQEIRNLSFGGGAIVSQGNLLALISHA